LLQFEKLTKKVTASERSRKNFSRAEQSRSAGLRQTTKIAFGFWLLLLFPLGLHQL